MIQIHPGYLFFKMSGGQSIPCSAEVATVELMGDAAELCDPELVRSAASAVLHYFKSELGRDCVRVDCEGSRWRIWRRRTATPASAGG